MASVIDDPKGKRRIQFVDPNGDRKTIRLGKIDRKSAESICRHVEGLLSSKIHGQPIPRDTAVWLTTVASALREKLSNVALVEPLQLITVTEFVTSWIEDKTSAGFKPTSMRAWSQTAEALKRLFGDRTLVSISHTDGEAYRSQMRERQLRPSSIHKHLGHSRQMFEDAVRLGHLQVNPWRFVRQRLSNPAERRVHVPVETIQKVIEHCPNEWWKLLVALARFAGLRIPSEAFSLDWSHVDWEKGKLTVPSPKTEDSGKTHRVIPIFPLLRPHLEAVRKVTPEGSPFLFPEEMRDSAKGPMGWGGVNLRTTFAKIIIRAGFEPWSRVWHSLRASCESDLANRFTLSTVTKWLGNTPSVALRHYIDPTETAFEEALNWVPTEPQKGGAKSGAFETQKEAQQLPTENRGESHSGTEDVAEKDFTPDSAKLSDILYKCTRECMGIEPTESFVQTPHRF